MMPTPQSFVFRLTMAASLGVLFDPGAELKVLRVTPAGDAAPTAAVTVVFDRPVAGSLDRSVDPRAVFAIAPAVPGTVDWRDPVTLRFRPAAPLTPNTTYTVTVADRFTAMDGSRLREPHVFTFRVRGPRVLKAKEPCLESWLSASLRMTDESALTSVTTFGFYSLPQATGPSHCLNTSALARLSGRLAPPAYRSPARASSAGPSY